MYLTWNFTSEITVEWEDAAYPEFLYQPLVDVVDASEDIDFLNPSAEKWDFALTLLSILEKNIKEISEEVFQKNGFDRKDITFFATMGDGDYVQEMLDESVKMFNS